MLTHGELFAGISGFGLGFARAGLPVAWAVEIDPACRAVLRRHHPEATILADVTMVRGADLAPVHVISAGFPCTDLSVAGRRAGLAGARSGLFYEIARIVREMREATDGRYPQYVVLENVPGLASSHRGWDFADVLDTLAECGALDIAHRVLDAQYWGLAQRRQRVFFVCDFGGERAEQILLESQGRRRHPPARGEAGQGTARGAQAGAGGGGVWSIQADALTRTGDGAYRRPGLRLPGPAAPMYTLGATAAHAVAIPALAACLTSREGKGPDSDATTTLLLVLAGPQCAGKHRDDLDSSGAYIPMLAHALRAEGFDASEDGTGRGTPLVPVAFSNRGIDAEVHETLPAASHGALPMVAHSIGVGIGGEDIGFALRANPSKSGDKGDGGMNVSLALAPGMAVRRLTPTECERLQGFPDGWTAGHSDSARYRMLGNAVAVPVAEWIGKRIVAASTCQKADCG